MDELTRSLLLKLRKGATAGSSCTRWKLVLQALGLRCEVTKKVRNSVEQVSIRTATGDQELVIDKKPGYRCVVFYDVGRWLKSIGIDTVAASSALLGLESPDEEKRLKELYVRDLTNTGTCPVCGGNFKRDAQGGMVHHGYQRPGDGYIYGDCFAVQAQPWEISPAGAQEYVDEVLKPNIETTAHQKKQLETGKVEQLVTTERKWGRNGAEKVSVTVTKAGEPERFAKLLAAAISRAGAEIEFLKGQVAYFEGRIAAWKPDILPEIKYAGKFRGS